MKQTDSEKPCVSRLALFLAFSRISLSSFGGAIFWARRELIERHLRFTGSTVALAMLDHWDQTRAKFVKVFPNEYVRALSEMHVRAQHAKPAGLTPQEAAAARAVA